MKKFVYTLLALTIGFTSCSKWTETESKAEDFEKAALEDLKNKRDAAKWLAEAERTEENKKALEAYWAQLREYKQKAWLNTGAAGGQVPMVYFWYDGATWQPKKGSAILMCWQTPGVGLGLPATKDGVSGYKNFHNKYPYPQSYSEWPAIYARELARYIIAMDFDGYDVDWETCGDHGAVTKEATPLMIADNNYENIANFVKEMAKYFGPVGAEHAVKTQAEREANLKALFDASTAGFHAKEKEYIDEFKPYLPANYLTKRYYFCADVPCDVPSIFGSNSQTPIASGNAFAIYFDKHFMQDYSVDGVNLSGSMPPMLGGPYYNSTSANYQAGNFRVMINKGKAVKEGKVWGLGAYHGQSDFAVTNESDAHFKKYLQDNNIKRKYLHYAWTREAIRVANPRPDYSGYKEMEPTIILP